MVEHANGDRPQRAVPGARTLPQEGNDAVERRRQAERILERNRQLVRGEEHSASEDSAGAGHAVNSDRSHAGGDYSND